MSIRFKRKITAGIFTLCLFCTAVYASPLKPVKEDKTTTITVSPTGAEVIAKYVVALGGKEKLLQVKSIVTKAKLSIPAAGVSGDVSMHQADKGLFSMLMEIPNVVTQKSGSDGKTIWESSNVTGAEILSGARAEQMKLQLTMFPSLDITQFFETTECKGTEMFAGQSCYVVESKKKGIPTMTTYYSVETGLDKGNRMTVSTAMGEMKMVSEIKSYGERDGIKFPMEIETTLPNGMKQVMTIEDMQFNTNIDPNEFKLPEDVEQLQPK